MKILHLVAHGLMAQWSITSSSSVRFRRQKARKPVCSGCVCLNLVYGCMSYIFFTSRHLYEVYMVQQGAAIRMGSAPHSCPSCTTRFSPSSGFPGGSDGKESACSAGDRGSIPGLGRSPIEGSGNPHQYDHMEKSMDREATTSSILSLCLQNLKYLLSGHLQKTFVNL